MPWWGVSALDAVEAFTCGVNLLREHMPETARVHYVVTEGGDAPNVVPARARVWVFTRGQDWQEQERLYQHVRKIVEGADLMAWGEEHGKRECGWRPAEVQVFTGLYPYNHSHAAARAMHANLVMVGPVAYTEEQREFAKRLQEAFGLESSGMHTEIVPFDPDPAPLPGGSTDVANISWVCPTIDLGVANWPLGVPGHSWASTAASGSSAGNDAMLLAAKVLACTGVDVLSDPSLVAAMRAELEESARAFPYVSPVGPQDVPALPSHHR
jgi:aminobenzoyl-glutamate utilization protein B